MPRVAYTNNTTNTNEATADRIVAGCQEVSLTEVTPTTNLNGEAQISGGSTVGEFFNIVMLAQGMRYDLPVGATINSATLYVNADAGGFGNFDLSLRKILKDWWVDNATWRTPTKEIYGLWETLGGIGATDVGPILDTTNVSGSGWVSFDISSIITDISADRNTTGWMLQSVTTGSDAFRFFDRSLAGTTDGIRWEVIVDYTGGTDAPTPPGQGDNIDFTGTNGDPIPAELTAFNGTFSIQDNSLNCDTTGAGIGGLCGADTGSSDGVYNIDYIGRGGDGGDAVGPFIRKDPASNNFIDLVQTGDTGAGLFDLVLVENDAPAGSLATFALPTYTNTDTVPIQITLDWDRIRIDIDGNVDAIDIEISNFHTNTIHGAKFGSANDSRVDNMALPSAGGATIDSITGVIAAGNQVTAFTTGLAGAATTVDFGGVSITIDSAIQDEVTFTIPSDIFLKWDAAYTLIIGDGSDTADGIFTLENRVSWNDRDLATAPLGDVESVYNVCVNYLLFTPNVGDQLQYTTQDNTNADDEWFLDSDSPTNGTFAVHRVGIGRTLEYNYRITATGLVVLTVASQRRRRQE